MSKTSTRKSKQEQNGAKNKSDDDKGPEGEEAVHTVLAKEEKVDEEDEDEGEWEEEEEEEKSGNELAHAIEHEPGQEDLEKPPPPVPAKLGKKKTAEEKEEDVDQGETLANEEEPWGEVADEGGGEQHDDEYEYYEELVYDPNAPPDLTAIMAKESQALGNWASETWERHTEQAATHPHGPLVDKKTETFRPIDYDWQKRSSNLVGLSIRRRHYPKQTQVPLTTPRDVIRTQPDGNCFFRAIAVAITGSSADHEELRTKLVDFMTHPLCAEALLPHHDYPTTGEYVEASKINEQGTWASDTEILAAAALLRTHIYMYAKEGRAMRWMKFPAEALIPHHQPEKKSIYLCHTGGCHYDYVTAVIEPRGTKKQNQNQTKFSRSRSASQVTTNKTGSS